ncbi:DMT family transporter [uncultured Faecalibaculum sp.]|uniref:DMT family transporter n=1 Tax=uncultured Faecalibaculum sp. TaxID=1729681 RepID=UPI0025EBF7B4|nr:DMT family transporter [uncultured Faecalibaculum sp.]
MNRTQTVSRQRKAAIMCLLTGAIWGFGFIATSSALDTFGPFQILLIRFTGAAILAWIPLLAAGKTITRSAWFRGLICGGFLFGAFALQTIGLEKTEAGSNAFFTAANVVMVPFLAWIVTRRRPLPVQFAACVLCFAGIGVMGWQQGGFALRQGDLYSLGCAFLFACHIVSLQWAGNEDADAINAVQMSTAALLSVIPGVLGTWPAQVSIIALLSVTYLIAGSTWLAFWLQTRAQEHLEASKASLLLATESLWANVFAILFLAERPSLPMLAGGAMILMAVWLTEKTGSTPEDVDGLSEPENSCQEVTSGG